MGRDESLDFVKFVAITLVIMVHVSAPGFVQFGPQWKAALLYRGLSSICVPLLFLATGALLLTRDASPASVFRRVKRIAIPAFLWSCVYLARATFIEHGIVGNWIVRILTYPAAVHLWFVYTIIGYYACLPLFSGFYRNSTDAQKLLVLGVWFIGTSINPFCYGLFGAAPLGIDFSFLPLYAGYPILGAMLYGRFRRVDGSGLVVSAVVALIALGVTIFGARASALSHGVPTMVFFEYSSPTVIVASAASFIALQGAFDRIEGIVFRRAVSAVAKRTMSIYFVHLLFVQAFFSLSHQMMFSNQAWSFYLIACAAALVTSTVIVISMQNMPGVRIMCPD
ncbi:acyltransferase [Paraburkholderia sp. RP-4-7]|uniref:Acyltransferase n=1 Tax=Paraburkholderia polaris TaxID=2728848 RepID=A0A848IMS8_9BURK|nr:acyltransferase family protein [Paraburkholderia polaris]NMM02216.1 acyltransferase [Paraburkholderia polaris]